MEGWKDRQKDGQTLFYRTLLATWKGSKKNYYRPVSFKNVERFIKDYYKKKCFTPLKQINISKSLEGLSQGTLALIMEYLSHFITSFPNIS